MAKRVVVTSITFEGRAHERPGHFYVPGWIARRLGSGDSQPISIRVEANGTVLFDGIKDFGSGTEIYSIDGIGPHDPITVTARRI